MSKNKSSSKVIAKITTEAEALLYLQKEFPAFFKDARAKGVAACVVMELHEELAGFSPIQRAGMIACIMTLMYDMGSAAISSTQARKNMADIFIENYRAKIAKETQKG